MYEVIGTVKKFDDISKLLDFYKSNSLSHHIDSIGEEVLSEDAVHIRASMQTGKPLRISVVTLHI